MAQKNKRSSGAPSNISDNTVKRPEKEDHLALGPDELSLTGELVRLDTRNPPGNERDAAHLLGDLLAEAAFDVQYHEFADRRTSVIAHIAGAPSTASLALTGHLDTVPLGAGPWTRNPFGADIDAGRIYGRGTTDMKAGVAAIVTAAIGIASSLNETPGLTVILTASEEGGCLGSGHLIRAEGLLPQPGALVVAEPTSNYPCIGHRGALKFWAMFRGQAAHGSMPRMGSNAIYQAAHAVTILKDFQFHVADHPLMGTPTLNVGTFRGGDAINSVPDEAVVGVDIRTTPGMNHSAILSDIRAQIGGAAELEVFQDIEAVYTDPGEPWIAEALSLWSALTGQSPVIRTLPYCTDGGNFRKIWPSVPVLILGPGAPEMAHQTDEYCPVSEISFARRIYHLLIASWCSR